MIIRECHSWVNNRFFPVKVLSLFLTVHYNGYLENDAEPFDSTRLRGPPQRMKLGGGNVYAVLWGVLPLYSSRDQLGLACLNVVTDSRERHAS